MIRIREKDILFIAINLVMFFGFVALQFMKFALFFVTQAPVPYPTIEDGVVYIFYTFADMFMITAGMITMLTDLWWLFRIFEQNRKERIRYNKENL